MLGALWKVDHEFRHALRETRVEGQVQGRVARLRREARWGPQAELLTQLLRGQLPLGLANLIISVVMTAGLAGRVPLMPLMTWSAYMLTTQMARLLVWKRFQALPTPVAMGSRLTFWLTTNSVLGGIGWGLFALIFFNPGTKEQLLVPFVVAGASATAITALSSYRPAYFGFIMPILVPFIAGLVLRGDRMSLYMAAISTVYLGALTIVGLRFSRSLQRAAKLHWRNLRLVRRLEEARGQLERRVDQRTAELLEANGALAEEVAERRRSEQQVRHLLAHDALTNMPNRLLLLDRLRQALARSERFGGVVAVLAFDIDRFKEVNDTYGHPAGDQLLRELAARLRSVVRSTDTPARMGGDEFALVAADLASRADAITLAEKLLAICAQPLDLGGTSMPISISVGISLYPHHGQDVDDLLIGADLALYAAKAAGRGRWSMFSAEMRAAAHSRRKMESQLREAVAGGQLSLIYQPRFSLENNRIVAAEALLRWQHPELGRLAPPDFIGIAESSGIIRDIGRWVLQSACDQARLWRDAGNPVRVAVNLSAVEFRQPDLPERIKDSLRRTGLEPGLLELEITESAYMDQREAGLEDELHRVKDLGVQLAIDDFGTGYSSLAYLKWLPFDILKIDRSFVVNMVEDQRDAAIVRTIVTLAQHLEKTVVAEGVERAHQLAALRRLGCHEAQGFLLGRPVEAEEVMRRLAA